MADFPHAMQMRTLPIYKQYKGMGLEVPKIPYFAFGRAGKELIHRGIEAGIKHKSKKAMMALAHYNKDRLDLMKDAALIGTVTHL